MDSIFVRKAHRGNGYGLQMLEDFVNSFDEDELGLRYPLSPAMANMCRHYLDRYPADVDLFWEVESVGGPYQRTRVAYKLSSTPLSDACKGGHSEDDGQNGAISEDQVEDAEETSLNITEDIVVNKHPKKPKVSAEMETPVSTRTQSSEQRRRKRVRDEDALKRVDIEPDKINRLEIPEEEKKADNSESEAYTETLEEADEDNVSAIGVEELQEMDEEHQAFVQKDASQIVKPATENQETSPATKDHQKMEDNSVDHLEQKKETAAEKERAVENEQKQVDTPEPKKRKVTAAAGEKQETVYGTERENVAAPISDKKQDHHPKRVEVVAPVSEEKQEDASSVKKEVVQVEGPAAKDKTAGTGKEQEAITLVEEVQELALEFVDEVDPAAEKEEDTGSETSYYKVDLEAEKEEVDSSTSMLSFSPAIDPEGEQGQEEALDDGNVMEVTGISEQSAQVKERQLSGENENTTLTLDEMMDETDEEEIIVTEPSDILQAFPEARTKAVPPTSKRTSKRLNKMTTEDGEEVQEKVKWVEKDKGMSTEGKKVMVEEEEEEEDEEHCSEEEEPEQDPPVIDKRVLRGKTKVNQTMQRTRGKRRGKM